MTKSPEFALRHVRVNWDLLTRPNRNNPTINRFQYTLGQVSYKDWRFEILPTDYNGHAVLLARFKDNGVEWTTRKWLLSPHMTRSEIIQTAFLCILTAEEHETRERFMVRGKAVFGPHFDVDRLHDLCEQPDHLDVRS